MDYQSEFTGEEIDAGITKAHNQGTDVALGTLTTKNPPIDADKLIYRNSVTSDSLVTSTWTQIKAFFKTYFDTLYATIASLASYIPYTGGTSNVDLGAHNLTVGGDTILGSGKYLFWGGGFEYIIGNQSNNTMQIGTNNTPTIHIYGDQRVTFYGKVGIKTTSPLRRLDINDTSGNCLRLIYNDADGNAANYVDFLVSSTGNLTITPSGGDIEIGSSNIHTTGALKGVHKANDGTSPVADGTYTVGLGTITNGTITIKDGIITAIQQAT